MSFILLPGGLWALRVDWWAVPDGFSADSELLAADPDRLETLLAAVRTAVAHGCPPHDGGHPAGVYWCEKCQPHPGKPDIPHQEPQESPFRADVERGSDISQTHKRKTPG